MKLIAAKYVYARLNEPSTDSAYSGYRSPGEVLTIDDITSGTTIEGNAVWYHCADDSCYYWSGAFAITNEQLTATRRTEKFSAHEVLAFYRSAANELGRNYQYLPGYSGIGVGYSETREKQTHPVLTIYIDENSASTLNHINDTINYRGITLYVKAHLVSPMQLHSEDPEAGPPYLMGGSIASLDNRPENKEISVGTRSLIVNKDGNQYLMTCYHVACASLFVKGTMEVGNAVVRIHLPSKTRFPLAQVITGKVIEGGFGINYDYALIETDISKLLNAMPDFLFGNGYYRLEELNDDLVGLELFKYGDKTKHTSGFYEAYPVNDFVVDKKKDRKMSGLMQVSKMSDHGDSGAPVVDRNNKFMGIIIGGIGSSSYIIPIAQLVNDFHFQPDL